MEDGFNPGEEGSTFLFRPQSRAWRRIGVAAQLVSPIRDFFLERGAGFARFGSPSCRSRFLYRLCGL